jgi:hypothetical protein
MAVYFTVGFEGFNVSSSSKAGKPFFGFGISIPLGKAIGD